MKWELAVHRSAAAAPSLEHVSNTDTGAFRRPQQGRAGPGRGACPAAAAGGVTQGRPGARAGSTRCLRPPPATAPPCPADVEPAPAVSGEWAAASQRRGAFAACAAARGGASTLPAHPAAARSQCGAWAAVTPPGFPRSFPRRPGSARGGARAVRLRGEAAAAGERGRAGGRE